MLTGMNETPTLPVLVGERLAAARRTAGLSQMALGRLCRTPQSHISGMERGQRAPSIELAKTLATALGVTVHWLIGGDSCAVLATRETGTEHLLADSKTPVGLATLAGDTALCEGLGIRAAEWGALRSLITPEPLTKEGYVAILLVLRGHTLR
jgi:transcriptional regulator with XRE-family HTH domain